MHSRTPNKSQGGSSPLKKGKSKSTSGLYIPKQNPKVPPQKHLSQSSHDHVSQMKQAQNQQFKIQGNHPSPYQSPAASPKRANQRFEGVKIMFDDDDDMAQYYPKEPVKHIDKQNFQNISPQSPQQQLLLQQQQQQQQQQYYQQQQQQQQSQKGSANKLGMSFEQQSGFVQNSPIKIIQDTEQSDFKGNYFVTGEFSGSEKHPSQQSLDDMPPSQQTRSHKSSTASLKDKAQDVRNNIQQLRQEMNQINRNSQNASQQPSGSNSKTQTQGRNSRQSSTHSKNPSLISLTAGSQHNTIPVENKRNQNLAAITIQKAYYEYRVRKSQKEQLKASQRLKQVTSKSSNTPQSKRSSTGVSPLQQQNLNKLQQGQTEQPNTKANNIQKNPNYNNIPKSPKSTLTNNNNNILSTSNTFVSTFDKSANSANMRSISNENPLSETGVLDRVSRIDALKQNLKINSNKLTGHRNKVVKLKDHLNYTQEMVQEYNRRQVNAGKGAETTQIVIEYGNALSKVLNDFENVSGEIISDVDYLGQNLTDIPSRKLVATSYLKSEDELENVYKAVDIKDTNEMKRLEVQVYELKELLIQSEAKSKSYEEKMIQSQENCFEAKKEVLKVQKENQEMLKDIDSIKKGMDMQRQSYEELINSLQHKMGLYESNLRQKTEEREQLSINENELNERLNLEKKKSHLLQEQIGVIMKEKESEKSNCEVFLKALNEVKKDNHELKDQLINMHRSGRQNNTLPDASRTDRFYDRSSRQVTLDTSLNNGNNYQQQNLLNQSLSPKNRNQDRIAKILEQSESYRASPYRASHYNGFTSRSQLGHSRSPLNQSLEREQNNSLSREYNREKEDLISAYLKESPLRERQKQLEYGNQIGRRYHDGNAENTLQNAQNGHNRSFTQAQYQYYRPQNNISSPNNNNNNNSSSTLAEQYQDYTRRGRVYQNVSMGSPTSFKQERPNGSLEERYNRNRTDNINHNPRNLSSNTYTRYEPKYTDRLNDRNYDNRGVDRNREGNNYDRNYTRKYDRSDNINQDRNYDRNITNNNRTYTDRTITNRSGITATESKQQYSQQQQQQQMEIQQKQYQQQTHPSPEQQASQENSMLNVSESQQNQQNESTQVPQSTTTKTQSNVGNGVMRKFNQLSKKNPNTQEISKNLPQESVENSGYIKSYLGFDEEPIPEEIKDSRRPRSLSAGSKEESRQGSLEKPISINDDIKNRLQKEQTE